MIITYTEYLRCRKANICSCHHLPVCKSCHGSGEVDAGITSGFVRTGTAPDGEAIGHPTRLRPNPDASSAIISPNPLVPLWGIAICGRCHGTGMAPERRGAV